MQRIGIDFDNTLVCYDQLFLDLAREAKLAPPGDISGKEALRDWLRQKPHGELSWQRLQALAYGKQIVKAKLFDGVREVLALCRQHGARVFVVSHKTRFAAQDQEGVNLHKAAHGFLGMTGLYRDGLLAEADVYFEETRVAKVARVTRLKCDLFIDDLVDVFSEPDFPETTRPLLFTLDEDRAGLEVCGSWQEIGQLLEKEWMTA